MRTPEVEAAMKRSVTDTELVETKTPPWNRETLASVDRRTLAAEIERLEAELAKSDEAARAAMYAVDERAFLAECAETSVTRAEAAEARVAELEAVKTPVCEWTPGAPPKLYTGEWFIARTKSGDPVVLRALPYGWSYDFTTADSTYIKAENVTHWMQLPESEYVSPSQARVKALQAQNARLWAALESLQSDAQCTIDLYNKNGPTWTSRDSGAEYYDASYVIGSAEERIATIKAVLDETKAPPYTADQAMRESADHHIEKYLGESLNLPPGTEVETIPMAHESSDQPMKGGRLPWPPDQAKGAT